MAAVKLIMRLPERFWVKTAIQDTGYETPCLVWTAGRNGDGYGNFWLDGKDRGAHRVAYEAIVGPVPDGLQLDHLCRVRPCVNASHLEPVTNRENSLRGKGVSADHVHKTHCSQGHPFDEANTYHYKGSRCCRACNRRYARAYARRRRAGLIEGGDR